MAMGAALLGLLALLLGCSGTSAEPRNSERIVLLKCLLMGNWKNDLDSTMQITNVSDSGAFSGIYQTAVSNSSKPIRPSQLKGVQHQVVDQRAQPTFGFTVDWSFSDSITVFVGQCFQDEDGKEQLKTTWLLRENVGSSKKDWGATKVGTNTFYRSK